MLVLGLTGGIACGKSTIARQFAHLGAKIFDADKTVHRLLREDKAIIAAIAEKFPECIENSQINRQKLGDKIFAQPQMLDHLEAILHPMIRRECSLFVRRMQIMGVKMVICDIPLLFETGSQKLYHANVAVIAPKWLQTKRALQRKGMTEEKLARILARQYSSRLKAQLADYVIPSSLGRGVSMLKVMEIFIWCFTFEKTLKNLKHHRLATASPPLVRRSKT